MVRTTLLTTLTGLVMLLPSWAAPVLPAPSGPEPVTAVAAAPAQQATGLSMPFFPASTAPVPRWQWPLAPRPAVARPFHAPPTPWSAGHRGADLRGHPGQQVRSAGAGRVTFSGLVAGRGVVVVTHPGGLRTSYEPVDDRLPAGADVGAGATLGTLAIAASHCAPDACLHWGLRRGSVYLDPLTLVDAGPVVLLPHTAGGP